MSLTIVLSNQKGGVGKTTSAYVLSTALKEKGYKVLAVDMDPQGNLSFAMGADTESATIYDVLKGELKPRYAVQKSALVDIIPSNILLSGIELEFTGARREFLLKEALESLKSSYDYILIDCPPSLGMITINALSASDQIYVPIQSEYFALEGVEQLMQTVALVKKTYNPELFVGGVIITMYDGRMRLSRDVVETVTSTFGDVVFKTMIPRNVRLAEAPSYGRAIIDYEALSKGALAYNALAKEVIKRG